MGTTEPKTHVGVLLCMGINNHTGVEPSFSLTPSIVTIASHLMYSLGL